jgi:DNA integrity scanning protein DisA with diadenylate cyclase activity
LPISQKLDLPERIGLRHKSAVGVTEVANAISIIVSETTGIISLAREGHLESGISMEELSKQIDNILNA